jgi:general secretion pathway protein A
MKRAASSKPASSAIHPSLSQASEGAIPSNPAPFAYRDYVAAKTRIQAALEQGPFYALVLGPSGTGKTSLVRELTQSLDRRQHSILYLSAPRVSLVSVTRHFAQALRVAPRQSCLETIKAIADQIQLQPTPLVAWIDEAAGISVETLAELRSLCEFNHEVAQLFSLVLSGPPELKSLLDSPPLFALKRRISVHCKLEGLGRDELDDFVVHRFGSVEARRVSVGLRDELFERARGIPALVDRVARGALDRAGKSAINEGHLREALDVAGL